MSETSSAKVARIFFSDVYLSFSRGGKIAYAAVFTALSVIANVFAIPLLDIQFSLTFTVTFLSGCILGPAMGFVVGFLGDLLGVLCVGLPYMPFVGIATATIGLIGGFVVKIPLRFRGALYIKLVLGEVLCLIICTCGINSYGLYVLYGLGNTFRDWVLENYPSMNPSYFLYVFYRLFAKAQLLVWAFNSIIVCILVPLLNRIKPLKLNIR